VRSFEPVTTAVTRLVMLLALRDNTLRTLQEYAPIWESRRAMCRLSVRTMSSPST
jgi:hypothetical protein